MGSWSLRSMHYSVSNILSYGSSIICLTLSIGMSDPTFVQEQTPIPPRSSSHQPQGQQRQLSQLEADEAYARRLAEQYNGGPYETLHSGYGSRFRGEPPMPAQRKQTGLNPSELHDEQRDYSFMNGSKYAPHSMGNLLISLQMIFRSSSSRLTRPSKMQKLL